MSKIDIEWVRTEFATLTGMFEDLSTLAVEAQAPAGLDDYSKVAERMRRDVDTALSKVAALKASLVPER